MKHGLLYTIIFVAGFLQACSLTYPIQVKQDAPSVYKSAPNKLHQTVGIYMDGNTKNYVVNSYKNGGQMIFHLGEALAFEAPSALKEVSDKIVFLDEIPSAKSVDRVLHLSFGPATDYVVGATVVSAQKVTIELKYEMTNAKGAKLFSGSSQAVVERSIGAKGVASGLFPMLFGTSLWRKGLGEVANDGIVAALENLNRDIMKKSN